MKNIIPFWVAVPITVAISLPFGVLIGKFNIALWASFIVWAQYFNYGASPKAAKIIFPCTFFGAFWGLLGMGITTVLVSKIPALSAPSGSGVTGTAIGLGIAVMLMVFSMEKSKYLSNGSLSYFNGLSLFLGMYFTGSGIGPAIGMENPYGLIFMAFIWTLVSGYFGFLLGWFNVVILFSRKTTTTGIITLGVVPFNEK